MKKSFREMFKIKQVNCEFSPIWRVFISGSSSAGKTYFARQLLEKKLFDYERIYYFHPDIDERNPTNWEEFLEGPVIYQAGLPSAQEIIDLPPKTCIILDDLYREASSSKHIDYLFRVLSGKLKLHVIIMTQRYFAGGPFALNIRNSSNYHVLMNNADCRINDRAANRLGLKTEYQVASKYNQSELYPYVFIDQTNRARVTRLQVFVDILSKHKKVIVNSMIYYLVSERDFKSNCEVIDTTTAKYVDKKQTEAKSQIKSSKEKSKHKQSKTDVTTASSIKTNPSLKSSFDPNDRDPDLKSNERDTNRFHKYLERRRIERAVRQGLQKYSRSSKL